MARGKRTRIMTGVYADAYGYAVIVKVDGVPYEERHPKGTPLEDLAKARGELRDKHEARSRPARRGTLAEDFAAYIAAIPKGRRRRDETALLAHWSEAGFGARARGDVAATDIQQQLAAWHGRFAPATLKHLRRILGAVYRLRNGKSGANPVRDVPQITVRYEEPRGLPYWLIEDIFSQIPDQGRPAKGDPRPTVNKTKLRLRVIAFTGLPPAQLGRLKPQDVDWQAKTLLARPRRKGEGAAARRLPLLPDAVAALQAFDAAHCWGPFSARAMAATWRRAVTRAQAGWRDAQTRLGSRAPWPAPDGVRAYDLRHSFGSLMYAKTRNLRAVSDAMLHATMETTKRYTLAAVDETLAHAFGAVAEALAVNPDGAIRVPSEADNMRQTPRQRSK